MEKFEYFRRFHGGWPIRDLIKKVLQNSTSNLKKDEAAKALAEQEDADMEVQAKHPGRPQKTPAKSSKLPDSDDSTFEEDDAEEEDDMGNIGDDDAYEGSEEEEELEPSGKKVSAPAIVPLGGFHTVLQSSHTKDHQSIRVSGAAKFLYL